MSSEHDDDNHGHSPAAWTAVVIMLVGFTIGTIAFWFDVPLVVWLSVGLVVVGLLAGVGMAKAGYGVNGPKATSKVRA
ncbi:hypothetical protein C5C31_11380 [Rathayibacter rathayi]|uniref:Uncharacterized protein n=1 Tax=Rathayibacter rathayi TaxID=33887 RepID=A0ABD6WBH7_RATRA|nr:DUF6704 family protein [Rathayibacter rathayi]AZZ48697.1 hypothetical protein C1O28_05410 [Rathayibacter rathayi]MWV73774.1 hypothetical protein [Rathayibacter rathayi NCPPB 2980 = VKM Ac-1601]PPF15772.1 hypothetical protein C5C04_02575 [Rathayibacter rathayi]PPF25305.1 hypothetical protein C5C34_02730 [Rathayibacter rathayi]PPF50859.1 hypothetical protein C5C08_04425 [Rathayibacter rathayi]